VHRGLAPSREAARETIAAGRVTVAGAPADKPARLVGSGDPIVVAPGRTWASRGAHKLEAALTSWPIAVADRRCLDAGASTGGFTDVLLTRGARQVVAVDVGRGQLLDRLRRDPRVVVLDRTNIRTAVLSDLGGEPFDLVVADLSFISLRTVAPVLAGELALSRADLVWLVKPQFEAGREVVARGRGIVRDPDAWRRALIDVGHALGTAGAAIMGAMSSPLRGADGNVEFVVWARAHTTGGLTPEAAADAALETLPASREGVVVSERTDRGSPGQGMP
jgi:23S rRNA (cytidine1920-2'-O)/16S rRNA (cytidine1409-2'-O)-methyltransferase